ncbi:hypothetical protein V5O48_018518 [Marasmius crinis-equi]|uniref:Uncharacterized protein n=1 Tax=Marasmius crinis-equi TaxID=585013 RepID=A0ABR3EL02_9AGAR
MADLTILSTVPIYPLPSASRSNVYKSFIPGGSSSRFSLGASGIDLPSTLSREGSEDTISDVEQEPSEDGQDTDDTSSSSSSVDDEPGGRTSTEEEDSESQCTPTHTLTKLPSSTSSSPPSSSPACIQTHDSLLPPPRQRGRQQYQRHRPTRSQSAPPFKTNFSQDGETTPTAQFTPNASQITFEQYTQHEARRQARRSGTVSMLNSPSRTFSSPPWASGGMMKGGELVKPPPPLHRPTTFWRRTPRSGVTSSSYSPASHLIRRSTFIAAGLPFDKPMADLSALGVECRVRNEMEENNRGAKVHDVFWEVVVDR